MKYTTIIHVKGFSYESAGFYIKVALKHVSYSPCWGSNSGLGFRITKITKKC